jgi:hypothetical protein
MRDCGVITARWRASAAAWQRFILISLEARIVARDAYAVPSLSLHCVELINPRISASRCAIRVLPWVKGNSIQNGEFLSTLPSGIVTVRVFPVIQGSINNYLGTFPWRQHEVPAHKGERSGVAKVHARELADRRTTDKCRTGTVIAAAALFPIRASTLIEPPC